MPVTRVPDALRAVRVAGLFSAAAVAAAGTVVALTAGAWYARRRWMR